SRSDSPLSLSTDTPPPHLSPLSLHAALPISSPGCPCRPRRGRRCRWPCSAAAPRSDRRSSSAAPTRAADSPRRPPPPGDRRDDRSEEHTSELQSLTNIVCPLLLDKKNTHYQP